MKTENIQDIYELSPLQHGILFHSLYAPETAVYFVQLCYSFKGNINAVAFEQAWQKVISRHTILRTAFYWEDLEKPLQVVQRNVAIALQQYDWRGNNPQEQKLKLQNFLESDRDKGFDFAQAPLLRISLIHCADDCYYFIWSKHHLILDGWSTALVLKEVVETYQAIVLDKELDLSLVSETNYGNYIKWLKQQDISKAEVFWRKQLQGVKAPTSLKNLQFGRSYNSKKEKYNNQSIQLSQKTTEKLQAFARSHQLTPNIVIQGAWAILLSRYSNFKDIVFGVTVSGRPTDLPEAESMVGIFINTLPTRIKVNPEAFLVPWLVELQNQQIEIRQHQYSSLVDIQSWSEIPSGLPLFESIFVFENYPVNKILKEWQGNLDIQSANTFDNSNYPLTISVVPGSELELKIAYNCDHFDAVTVSRILGHFQTLFQGIVSRPQVRLKELPILTAAEEQQILREWNNTKVEYPQEKCIHELFETQVAKTPDSVAVSFESQQLTYRELDDRANQLARYLQKQGVKPESLVGICINRSFEMVIGLLGILKAGGAYVPLDPNYPTERIDFMLEDAQASILLSQTNIVKQLPNYSLKVVCLDSDEKLINQESKENLINQASPKNTSYVLYTSGSTGKPKAVVVEHQNTVAFLSWAKQVFSQEELRGVLASTSICFDLSIFELFCTLSSGGRLIIVENALSLPSLPGANQVTLINTVPSAIAELLRIEGIPASVRTVNLAGEALHNSLVQRIYRQETIESVFNLYGPSEDTTYSTFSLIKKARDEDENVTIGRPIANTQIYLLDPYLKPSPVRVTGEIYIAGAGIARGYLNRPELTAERFIPNLFSENEGSRLYKTGDLAKYLENGEIEYISRIDYQVKLRGFRIELGEIEAKLTQHPAISTSVVILREDIADNHQLVAYLTLQSEQTTNISVLRSYLESKLPGYMVPSALVILESLPLTANGKVDRKALPIPDSSQLIVEEYLAPTTPTQEMLANIWQEILGVERIGVSDNFFALGGHSLIATRVVSQIRQVFNIEIPLRSLFEKVTIGELGREIETALQDNLGLEISIIKAVARNESLPLSFAQQRLWFLAQLEGENPFYNVATALRLTGDLSIIVLKRSLEELVRRHEPLRTRFSKNSSGVAVQNIQPAGKIALPIINLENLNTIKQEREIQNLANLEAQKVFNLEQDALLRVTLIRVNSSEHIILFTTHHIVSDEWSTGILVKEMTRLYQAYSEGKVSPLPELGIQYADFAVWQREWLTGEVLATQLNYWQKQLENTPPLNLGTDYPRPGVNSYQGGNVRFEISSSLTAGIKNLAKKEGVTIFMTLLAAFKVLLARYSNQEDIAIGTPIANRNRGEIEGLIGFFVNTLVLRTNLEGSLSFRELLQRVREITLGAYTHQDLPFEQLVEEMKVERHLNRNPLFDVMFTLENSGGEELRLPGLTLNYLEAETQTAIFDLTLSISETELGLVGCFEYSTELFKASTIEGMVRHFQVLLEAITSEPEVKISQLPILTESERQQLLVDWNDTETEYPQEKCIHELFEEQVEKTPEAVAVVFEEQQLSYGELNNRANQLAHYLQQQGVKPEVKVGIYLERSLEMSIAILGVLKVGGAYVPIDPVYPTERVSNIVEDAQIEILLTQESLKAEIAQAARQSIYLDSNWSEITQYSTDNCLNQIDARNLAYVIYTSGSTGKPKGVAVTHQALVNYTLEIAKQFELQVSDRILQFASLGFDVVVEELFPTWITGATVVLLEHSQLISCREFQQLINQQQLTVFELPTAYWQQWVSELFSSQQTVSSCVRLVIVGGERISSERLKQWQSFSTPLVHVYGLTETTVTSTLYHLDKYTEVSQTEKELPIGKPVANTEIYLLDSQRKAVPIGVAGEIYIGGEGIARGYLGRAELTAERFIPNSFSDNPGSRLYKTGDLAKYRDDGNIEFIGRVDYQVKLRGFRIELGEIEAVLSQHPVVANSIVILREDIADNHQLVAYLTLQSEQTTNISVLRSYLESKLPGYMVPSALVILESLPLTANGKVDRKALPIPDSSQLIVEEYLAPTTPTQEMLVNIWQEILAVERIGVSDNFFSLGGHSLIATSVVSQIRQVFNIEIPLRSLFEKVTIGELGREIETALQDNLGLEISIIKAVARNESLPLSFAQQRLWFLAQLEGENPFYNVATALRLTGDLSIIVLKRSLEELVRRHEPLRTRFSKNSSGVAVQNIQPAGKIALPIINLENLNTIKQEREIQNLANLEAQKVFNLEQDALLRVTLIRVNSSEHIILFTTHHIVSDEWSTAILVKEITTLYRAYSQGKASPLPELAIQYADFAVWQREWLTGEVLATQLNYWQKQLQDLPRLDLSTDYSRPTNTTYQGASYTFELCPSLTAGIKALAQTEGVTIFMTLLAAFKVLLSRYSNQEDIAVGTPIANRNRSEIEGLIGFFLNTLVLRTNLEGSLSFRELLQKVKEITLGAYTHQDIPFEQLVEEMKVERNLNRNPLFDVMFTLENKSREELALPGLTLSELEQEIQTAKFDLTLSVRETETGYSGAIEYSSELFSESTIKKMIGHFQVLLEAITVNPEQKISRLPLLTNTEQQQLLVEWNKTKVEYPQDKCIHELFEEQVAKTPDAVAVVWQEQQLTYRELNDRANQLAHYLRQQGVSTEVLVGICLERSLDMPHLLLGILKAGGAYVPLDPAYPQNRLAFMLKDAKVKVLLTQEKLATGFSQGNSLVICVDKDWNAIAQKPETNIVSETTSQNLAYVMYTSGSTGKPKGVMIPHQGLVNYLSWCTQAYAVAQGGGSPVQSSIGFDATITSLYSPLLVGQKVVLLPEKDEIEALSHILSSNNNFSLVKLTPAHLELLSQLLPTTTAEAQTKALIVGGEALLEKTLSFWRTYTPQTRIINEYGPTETVVGCCVYEISEQTSLSGAVPIGHPIANTELYILDNHLQPVPIGVVGELYIGGDGVARGYFNRPELTGEKFIPNPFSQKPGERLYKTGDLARYQANGEIEYLGRIDHQVKIRGFRIELGEIEAVLAEYPAIKEVVVIAQTEETGNKRLVGYVVSKGETSISSSVIRSYLKSKLPGYMVPSALVILEALPLTANGKVDRKALPIPDSTQLIVEEYLAPVTPTQEMLVNIWQEILAVERIGVSDNFFSLGGHSLIATRVVSKIREVFKIELPLRSLFEKPTIAELAQEIETASQANLGLEISIIQAVARTETLPLSYAQQRLWFLAQLEAENPFYNVPTALKLSGELNIPVLQQSLRELVRRHEVLRTTFSNNQEGKTVQIINPEGEIALPIINLEQLNSSQQEPEIQNLANLEAEKVFNLEQDALLRVTLLRLNSSEHIILFTTHHIVSDEWSTAILVKEITTLYRAYSQGKASPLPELAIQYADFAVWQREWLTGEVLATQLNYWQKQLQDLPRLDLSTDYSRPTNTTYQGASYTFELCPSLTAGIKALAQTEGVTIFMTLLAAFKVLLSRYSNQEDIAVGTPIANRNRSEIEGLIGFFLNTLVLRTNLEGSLSFRELLQKVKEITLGAYTHQDIPFEQLVEEVKVERHLNRNPLFDVMFTLENKSSEELKLPGLSLSYLEQESQTAKFDLTLSMTETELGLGLVGCFEYSTELFKASTIKKMIGHFQVLLEAITVNPEQKLSQLPILTATEEQQLLVEWNDTQVEYPKQKCIHELFEEQVAKKPDAVAVVFEEQQLTYGELNNRANQLAHYLQQQGVKPEVKVGICIERSLEMVIGLLGILKAGGAYLPLDPTYPIERLAFMITDARVSVILAQQHLVDQISTKEVEIICLDNHWTTKITTKSQENSINSVKPENLIYTIYTSGSTGIPKGVMNTHYGLVNRLLWMQDTYQLKSFDRVLQKTPFSFDVSVWEFFWTLIAGATLITAKPGGHQDSQYLVELIDREQISTLHFVPPMLQVFLEEPELDKCISIKRVICSGEALPFTVREKFFARLDARLDNLYGPTEAAIDVTSWHCQRNSNLKTVPIGKPIANTQIYLLDSQLQPVPVGVVGEIYIGGAGIARGYLNRPELTAERFIPNSFSNNNNQGSRLYRTGDLARYLENEEIEYLGRIDHQVKLRGFRIELGEIEAKFTFHPKVSQAVVQVREDVSQRQRLVAYLVSDRNTTPSTNELRSYLKEKLPEYMIPSVFITLETFPLTPNGKIDRKALPTPDLNITERKEIIAPRTSVEETLVKIWTEVLQIDNIGVYDNFFELGGDSIVSLQVIAKANQAGIQITPKQIFEHQTIAELAIIAKITDKQITEQGLVTGTLNLTPIQHRFFEQELTDSHHYNQSVMLQVKKCNPIFLEKSLHYLSEHHDVLRSRFVETESGWQSIIERLERTIPFTAINLSELHPSQQTKTIEAIATRLQSSLNLKQSKLLRIALFDLGREQPSRLLIIIHHLIIDGVSWRILLEDLETAYQQLAQEKVIQLPAKTISYKLWSERLQEYAQSTKVGKELDYWLKRLTNSKNSLPTLSTDFVGGDNTVALMAKVSITLTEVETQALLSQVPSAYQTQINDILLTALVQTFQQWTGNNSLLIELEGHGREDILENIDLSRTVGWFTTVFPVILDLETSCHPGEILKTIKEQLRSIPQRGINYGVLRYLTDDLSIKEKLHNLPQAEVRFNYLGQFDQVFANSIFEPATESTGRNQSLKGHQDCLLDINGAISVGQLRLEWSYSKALYRETTIQQLAESYLEKLRSLIIHCQDPDSGGYTPSDFSEFQQSQWNEDDLESITAAIGGM